MTSRLFVEVGIKLEDMLIKDTASIASNQTGGQSSQNLVALLASNSHHPLRIVRIANDALLNPETLNPTTLDLIEAAVNGLPDCFEKIQLQSFIRRARVSLPADVNPFTDLLAELGGVVVDAAPGAPEGYTPEPQKVATTAKLAPVIEAKLDTRTDTLYADVEMLRIAIALNWSREFLVWLIVLDDVRKRNKAEGKGYDWTTLEAIKNAVVRLRIKCSRPSLLAWLKSAVNHGFLTRDGERYYMRGKVPVASLLTREALARNLPQLVLYDKPGGKEVAVKVGGDTLHYHAYARRAWLYAHDNPTISRDREMELWRASKPTLRKWDRTAKIKVIRNNAQTVDPDENRIPDHAVPGQFQNSAGTKRNGWRWQRVNTYQTKRIPQRNHIGQGRKCRKAVNDDLSVAKPPEYGVGEQPKDVRNFAHENRLDAWKAYQKALKTRSIDERPMDYLKLGQPEGRQHKRAVDWELMIDDRPPQISAGDYVPLPKHQQVRYDAK